ncbi:hypothetical protein M409DRAFT_58992 [Zasmidium cellare ATCC 36951]|uniref:Uncharacterized protein n=1 Tax=Zasmidium cellare ATCC 36951 TaxID=1080233 RepID=A0A6A6C6U1_ZASCE|nr:uncharacterized protein M409DRAFT_58992 [Zasmidium cellare ATCC 36951]KAF2161602.1 hypothetical protein M409DRAFT_58992 [Zasmidium cellare ATCC 36951]
MTNESDPDSQQSSRLLALPGELKNRIYRLALLQPKDTPILITSTGYDLGGGLLQTSKQIRSEALKIFYYENQFKHTVQRLDVSPAIHFCRTLAKVDLGPPSKQHRVSLLVEVFLTPHWPNLLEWLRLTHQGFMSLPVEGMTPSAGNLAFEAEKKVVASMFEAVKALKRQPWRLVREVLRGMRQVLVVLEPSWGDDWVEG